MKKLLITVENQEQLEVILGVLNSAEEELDIDFSFTVQIVNTEG